MKNEITFLILFILLAFSNLQAQVTQEWVARYNGPANIGDIASSLTVDDSGNVYVTGSEGNENGTDYATIKYNSSGFTLWIARYNGPSNSFDGASSLAVDDSGNVFITGKSYDDGYATIKYNCSGVQQWVQLYNGKMASGWTPSLAVDNSGNVYVTGYSNGYATIKYNSSGVMQWVQIYNGSLRNNEPPLIDGWNDEFFSVAVGVSGNVYVTGASYNSATGRDYATIKYNSEGALQWIQTYSGSGNRWDQTTSIAIDNSENVYVTGFSGSDKPDDFDYATIKYNSLGIQQWVQRYNGPGNGWDWPNSLAVDSLGNIYVTGSSDGGYATIKYSSLGIQRWVQTYHGGGASSVAIDYSGNVYVTGYTNYATIKYNSSGIQQWIQGYSGPGNGDNRAQSVTVDGSGNVYITGYSNGRGTGYDFATIKYSQTEGITAPSNLEAQSVDSSFIKVTWQGNSDDEGGFYIERTLINDTSHWEVIDAVPQNVNQYEDYLVTRNLKYYYRVNAYSGNIFSGYSNTDSAILGGEPALIPAPPSKLTFLKRTPKATLMGWHDNSGNENGFIIFRKSERDLFFKIIDSVNTDVVTYQEVGVYPNLNYSYKICSFNASGISDYSNTLTVLKGKNPLWYIKTPELSGNYILYENYPNPFNPVTNLEFGISKLGFVSLKIYDMLGKEVATLVNASLNPGTYKYSFDASSLPSGVYFYKLTVDGNNIDTKRMILLK